MVRADIFIRFFGSFYPRGSFLRKASDGQGHDSELSEGGGEKEKVGNWREGIKPRSTMCMILPPSTLFLASRSGCHDMMPSAFPDSMNDSISANFIRPGSFAVFAS